MQKPMKGVILAAGFGSRLSPLTQQLPKPLLPLGENALIDLGLKKLRDAGIKDVAINTHHLADHLNSWAQKQENLTVFYEPKILGTLGAFAPMSKWRDQSDLVIINSDIYHPEPLTDLLSYYHSQKPGILMSTRSPAHQGATPLWVRSQNQLISIGGPQPHNTEPHSFACAQIISNNVLNELPTEAKELAETYRRWLKKDRCIEVFPSTGVWADLGTPADYYNAHFLLSTKDQPGQWHHVPKGTIEKIKGLTLEGPCFIAKDVLSQNEGYVGPGSVVYSGCQLKGAQIRKSLLLPETLCKKSESIDDQIRYQNISIAL